MKILKHAVGIVATLFFAFKGSLLGIAPPEEVRKWPVAFALFFLLIIFLAVSALVRTVKGHRTIVWVAALGCAPLGWFLFRSYQTKTYALTFLWNGESYVKGEVLTQQAQEWKANNIQATDSELVSSFGGPDHKDRIWTPESIAKARVEITEKYILFVVPLLATVLFFLEGLVAPYEAQPPT